MKVQLLHHTPLSIADIAICKCYGNTPHEDIDKVQSRINRVANVSKHASTIEHLYYNFDIDGVSRALLQELARHRLASYTVKSSRYTLGELLDTNLKGKIGEPILEECEKFIVFPKREFYKSVDTQVAHYIYLSNTLISFKDSKSSLPNDVWKYGLPEAYKTSLVWSINARSLQNFLELRSSKHALWEIQLLAKAVYEEIPEEHKFLYSIGE